MKDRPILFSGAMVAAILAGRKSQTRRVVKPTVSGCQVGAYMEPGGPVEPVNVDPVDGDPVDGDITCPFGRPGDRLWVRETFYIDHTSYLRGPLPKKRPNELDDGWSYLYYRASFKASHEEFCGDPPWRPSIHMPRWASRITLEITGLRCERLNDISEEDALAEGVQRPVVRMNEWGNARPAFIALWESINGAGSWDANPWVWVISFKRVEDQP